MKHELLWTMAPVFADNGDESCRAYCLCGWLADGTTSKDMRLSFIKHLENAAKEKVNIVFDGPPGPTGGRFIETEDLEGNGVGIGEWVRYPKENLTNKHEPDRGWWVLQIEVPADKVRR